MVSTFALFRCNSLGLSGITEICHHPAALAEQSGTNLRTMSGSVRLSCQADPKNRLLESGNR